MSKQPANIFNDLFDCRPREGHTPKENFLTEALVHVLRTSEPARDAWLSLALGKPVNARSAFFQTRRSERENDADRNPIFPDLWVEASLSDGPPTIIYSEHKWDSKCNPEQLRSYQTLAKRSGPNALVIFIAKTHRQMREAKQHLETKETGRRCFLWEEVFDRLNSLPAKTDLLRQLLDFMKTNGLNPEPALNPAHLKAMRDYWNAWNSLTRILTALRDQDWQGVFPERFSKKRNFHEANGTRTVLFTTEAWRPAITVGFLYDPAPYKVNLIDGSFGDLSG